MDANTAYAFVQTLHNVGAVAVVGSPAAAWLWLREAREPPVVLAWTTLSGWLLQALSGSGFALVSYLSSGELPEIAGAALVALDIKIACAVGGIFLMAYCLINSSQRRAHMQRWMWVGLFGAGVTALCSAAVLRWFG